LFWKLVAEINTRDNIVVLTVFSPLYWRLFHDIRNRMWFWNWTKTNFG
jgi:hypothetical protein